MKVLIIQQKMIGDVLTSSMLFETLKHKYPTAELHYLIKKNTLPVVVSNPYIDRIIIDREDFLGKKLGFVSFIFYLRKKNYSAVIDIYSKIGSAIITWGTGAKLRIGRKKWYTWYLYTFTKNYEDTPESIVGKAIQFRMDLLKPLGISGEQPYRPKISLTQNERDEAKNFMVKSGVDLSKPIVMCSVLGSGPLKSYPLPYLAEVLKTIVETNNVQLLFNYLPSQQNLVEELMSLSHYKVTSKVIRICYATNLRQFISILSFCDVLIGNEGGAVHMAKAVNIPTFAIFSPQIKKDAWFNQEKGQDEGVHLEDYKPELFADLTEKKELLKASQKLYDQFKPEYFEDKLVQFVKTYIKRVR